VKNKQQRGVNITLKLLKRGAAAYKADEFSESKRK